MLCAFLTYNLRATCPSLVLHNLAAQSTHSDAENHLVEHEPEGALTHFRLICVCVCVCVGGGAQFDGQDPETVIQSERVPVWTTRIS